MWVVNGRLGTPDAAKANIGFLIYTLLYAMENGADIARLYHGFNYKGDVCGTSTIENRSYLYGCPTPKSTAGAASTHW